MLLYRPEFPQKKNTARQNAKVHHHNTNALEPTVKLAKYHIISHITTMGTICNIELWSEMILEIQDILTMVCTSRNYNKITTYYGEIMNLNHMTMASLGNTGVVYITDGTYSTFACTTTRHILSDNLQTTTNFSSFTCPT